LAEVLARRVSDDAARSWLGPPPADGGAMGSGDPVEAATVARVRRRLTSGL
jgi:hypothetical protein